MIDVPERRAAVDQSNGLGNITITSVPKFCLSFMKHFHLPLKTEHRCCMKLVCEI